MLLKIKRLQEVGKIEFNRDLGFGLSFSYLNVFCPDKSNSTKRNSE